MLLTNLNSNELYNEIKSLIEFLVQNEEETIDIDNLQVYITHNTYYKSRGEREVIEDFTQDQILLDLFLTIEQLNNSIGENIIRVINNNTTFDISFNSFMNSDKKAVYLTIYKIEE